MLFGSMVFIYENVLMDSLSCHTYSVTGLIKLLLIMRFLDGDSKSMILKIIKLNISEIDLLSTFYHFSLVQYR